MIKIILYGDINDKNLADLIIDTLEGEYNITYQTPTSISSYMIKNIDDPKNPPIEEILIIETDIIKSIESSDTIVIFKNSISNNIQLDIKNNIMFIVYSENTYAIDFLSKTKVNNVITFGLHLTDTLTISSVNDQEKLGCLLRQVYSIHGDLIEPFEFVIKSSLSLSIVLPLCSILILLNKIDQMNPLLVDYPKKNPLHL